MIRQKDFPCHDNQELRIEKVLRAWIVQRFGNIEVPTRECIVLSSIGENETSNVFGE